MVFTIRACPLMCQINSVQIKKKKRQKDRKSEGLFCCNLVSTNHRLKTERKNWNISRRCMNNHMEGWRGCWGQQGKILLAQSKFPTKAVPHTKLCITSYSQVPETIKRLVWFIRAIRRSVLAIDCLHFSSFWFVSFDVRCVYFRGGDLLH